MPPSPDPWWSFSLDPTERADPEANRLRGEAGAPLVNAPGEGGRLALDYAGYLGLDALLSSQRPASSVPDERVFVVVHQLCELVFKQMTFDLAVVAATMERLLRLGDGLPEMALARGEVDDETSDVSAFWRPAITASNRLRHAARQILPPVMQLMGRGADDDVLFSGVEFGHFRAHLEPSSGFQTAQLRLVQRALGKGPLLDLRVFPGGPYGQHYTGSPCGHVSLGDPVILRDAVETAAPPEGTPAWMAGQLDRLVHLVLARVPPLGAGAPEPPAVARIHADDVERAIARFVATLGPDAPPVATDDFRADIEAAAMQENARRDGLGAARAGAFALQALDPGAALVHVLDRLVAVDDALHSPRSESFLTVHRKTVRRHVADDSGTGGGGMPYLVTSQRFLLPLFPALVAYLDLDDPVG
ncbi:MAG TPA: hypothetical protein VF576_12425 [Rubricoccaceae bacterium]|jgi:tryptophan 2,3-dioxygenase